MAEAVDHIGDWYGVGILLFFTGLLVVGILCYWWGYHTRKVGKGQSDGNNPTPLP
jgi:hypothetical protein